MVEENQQLREELEILRAEHRKQVASSSEDFAKEREGLRAQHSQQISELQADLGQDMGELKAKHNQQMGELQADLGREMGKLQAQVHRLNLIVNPYKYFPEGVFGQCYPLIKRKYGEGEYSSKKWIHFDEAGEDIKGAFIWLGLQR